MRWQDECHPQPHQFWLRCLLSLLPFRFAPIFASDKRHLPDASALETVKDGFSLPLSRHIVVLPANRKAVSSWWQEGGRGGLGGPDTQLPYGVIMAKP